MWKEIPGWEWYLVNEKGEVKNSKTGNYLKGDINSAGYYRVCLYNNGTSQKYFRHRLVAELFINNFNNYKEVNHINGNKSDNSVTNLEWCDRTHNEREAHRNNIKEYKPYKVIFNNNEEKQYEFAVDLANEIGVTKRTVQNYLQGKSFGYKNKGIKYICYL